MDSLHWLEGHQHKKDIDGNQQTTSGQAYGPCTDAAMDRMDCREKVRSPVTLGSRELVTVASAIDGDNTPLEMVMST
jgi:hypothetical protein